MAGAIHHYSLPETVLWTSTMYQVRFYTSQRRWQLLDSLSDVHSVVVVVAIRHEIL